MTRADRAIRWIEQFCVVPTGSSKGQYVRLTLADREAVARIYRDDGSLDSEPVSGELAGFLALLHVCGVEALGNGPAPVLQVDPWTVWAAAGPRALAVLRRDGEAVTCPE